MRGKAVQDARHGLRGVVGVQGREHQVAGLGGGERGGHGFAVAHFAHQDHVGVCRTIARTEWAKLGVSWPTSICSMMELRLACRYSIGSSMVTMWSRRRPLIESISAASVEVLPEPVAR